MDGVKAGGEGFSAKLHGIVGPVVVRSAIGTSARRRLFEGLQGGGQDDLSDVLWEKRKGKVN